MQLACNNQKMKKDFDDQTALIYHSVESNSDSLLTGSHLWGLIDSHLGQYHLGQHQLDSYHHFLEDVRQLVLTEGRIAVEVEPQFKVQKKKVEAQTWHFQFKQPVCFSMPSHREGNGDEVDATPMACRLRDLSYLTCLSADLHLVREVQIDGKAHIAEEEVYSQIEICNLPVMVGSRLCHSWEKSTKQLQAIGECTVDKGGYFIIRGSEKVLVGQQRQLENEIEVTKTGLKTEPWRCEILSRRVGYYSMAQLIKLTLKDDSKKDPYILLKHRMLKKDLPICLLMFALDVSSDLEIVTTVCDIGTWDQLYSAETDRVLQVLRHSLTQTKCKTKKDCLNFIGKFLTYNKDPNNEGSCIAAAQEFIHRYFLPHIGATETSNKQKAKMLGYMMKRLIQSFLSDEEPDKRQELQHLGRKRIDLSGQLLMNLFLVLFKRKYLPHASLVLKKILADEKKIDKKIQLIFDSRFISKEIISAMTTGNWVSSGHRGENRTGISQVLKRQTNYLGTLSQLRKISSPYFQQSRDSSQRLLHNTHFGMLCPCQTPQGKKLGIIKYLALLTVVSFELSKVESDKIIKEIDVILRRVNKEQCDKDVGFHFGVKKEQSVKKEKREGKSQKKRNKSIKKQDNKGSIRTKRESQLFAFQSTKIKPEEPFFMSSLPSSKIIEEQQIIKQENWEIEPGLTKIFLNGNWIASTQDHFSFLSKIRRARRECRINHQISVYHHSKNREIHLHSDKGRLMRPLLIVQSNNTLVTPSDLTPTTTLNQLVRKGLVEYIDAMQEENSLIAMDPSELISGSKEYTHCEISPATMFGISASFIPFANHNQATKNTMAANMAKQAIGITTNCPSSNRFDATDYQLYYQQKPLVQTHMHRHTSVNQLPMGLNAIVASAVFTGYNQEDSIIVNQSAIERGMFRTAFYRSYSNQESVDNYGHSENIVTKPSNFEEFRKKKRIYNMLEDDGMPPLGYFCEDQEIIIGGIKVKKIVADQVAEEKEAKMKDGSTRLKRNERARVDMVMLGQNQQGYKVVKVKTRSIKIPEIGDKFASRHGQKGTIGMIYRQQDLPFSAEGVVPELVVNPHCIPSRMTIGHILECQLAKYAAARGKFQDATPFEKQDYKELSKNMVKAKLSASGSEMMTNPFSGKPFENLIFMGPIYYQRLRHLVDDKIFYRTRGMINALTRQPLKGRANDGGLRFGEMERDCILSHGLTEVLKERLFTVSDYFVVNVCGKCGILVNRISEIGKPSCHICRQKGEVYEVQLPYATKLLMQELMSAHILPRLKLTDKQ